MDLTPEEIAALRRVRDKMADLHAAVQQSVTTANSLAPAMQRIMTAMQEAYDQEVAKHPDLAELDVQLDGFYRP